MRQRAGRMKMSRREAMLAAAALPWPLDARAAELPEAVDALVTAAIARQGLPGAVARIGRRDHTLLARAWGWREVTPGRAAMTADTIFDMASMTKVMVTAPAAMQLWEQRRFGLDDPVGRHLPEFGDGDARITLRHLLTHHSGLPPDVDLRADWRGRQTGYSLALRARPIAPPGTRFIYSDINFILLGLLVERLSGLRLDAYARRFVLDPLGLANTGFLPPAAWLARIAPTQWRWGADGQLAMTRGVVHDPTAFRMGGIAGHAGLFSDVDDVARYAAALLDRRAGRPSAYPLRTGTVRLMTTPQQPAQSADLRGLGWDIDTHYSSPRGGLYPKTSFGHTGFTGTSLWLDPGSDSFAAMLTNRVHPDGGGHGIVALRRDVATAAARAVGLG